MLERSKVNIDTVLSYCHCCLHDTELLDYKEYFKVKLMGSSLYCTVFGLMAESQTVMGHLLLDCVLHVC